MGNIFLISQKIYLSMIEVYYYVRLIIHAIVYRKGTVSISCDEYISKIPAVNHSKLDDMVSDIHCAKIAELMVNWQLLAPSLELHRAAVRDIAHAYKDSLPLQG